ncbi:MAG TPA: NlpC/P60 family protein [Gemmatimonas sp.]|uniref:C40 family peptidase n=1 Tax=Gemmatimonas sp. TaxID=1962908 RepID=UPI002EDB5AEE
MTDPLQSNSDRRTVRTPVAPLLGEPRISTALTSQLLAGEVVDVIDGRGDWMQVRGMDGYEGWTHVGYLAPSGGGEGTWRWSLGCLVREANGVVHWLPLGARIAAATDVMEGLAIPADARAPRFLPEPGAIAASAASLFSGASYLWGGVTPWGVDCSGLVQRIALLHGVPLPRDAWQQALASDPVGADAEDAHQPADLLFFSDREDRRITHVGMALGDGRMVHSALARGGVTIEQLAADDPYVARLRAQCTGVHRMRLT